MVCRLNSDIEWNWCHARVLLKSHGKLSPGLPPRLVVLGEWWSEYRGGTKLVVLAAGSSSKTHVLVRARICKFFQFIKSWIDSVLLTTDRTLNQPKRTLHLLSRCIDSRVNGYIVGSLDEPGLFHQVETTLLWVQNNLFPSMPCRNGHWPSKSIKKLRSTSNKPGDDI